MYFAEDNLWIIIANVLATMTIRHKLESDGKPIEVTAGPDSNFIS